MGAKEKINRSKKQARGISGFMSGVLVLSLSTIIVKVIGLGVKIPLLSVLGAEGMGYFNSAYEIYALLCVVSTAGLPTALSMLVSANNERGAYGSAKKAYRLAMMVFLILGAVGSMGMLLFAKRISSSIGNEGAYYSILAIAPALLLICVSSAVRGYFQGLGNMTPTAVSQLIEALGKLVFGVAFGYAAVKNGYSLPEAAAMSVLGLTLGILISSIYLLYVKIRQGKSEALISANADNSDKGLLMSLLRIAFPITIGSAVISSCRIVDMALILRRLQSAGLAASAANEIYGAYTTLAVPVFGLVPSLITPVSLSLIPAMTAAVEGKNKDMQAEVFDKSIRLTILLSMPASMGIAIYARPILELLFSGESEAISMAAPLLSVLGISVMFSGLITATNAILQAYGKTVRPIISMGIGTGVKIILAYILIGNPDIGAYGAPISTLACDLTVTVINLYMLSKSVPKSEKCSSLCKTYLRPLGASVCAMLVSIAAYLTVYNIFDSTRLSFLCALIFAVTAYLIFAFLFGAAVREDISDIPMGDKILKIADKLGKRIRSEKRKET